jgi:hypothetical protein
VGHGAIYSRKPALNLSTRIKSFPPFLSLRLPESVLLRDLEIAGGNDMKTGHNLMSRLATLDSIAADVASRAHARAEHEQE